ncbi:hypothetical protein [Rubrivirga sp.]|uniref:hypothetical protein n=1 Tax=Rubrivirga sp. TaxID=1885344 RepID=UPI003C733683
MTELELVYRSQLYNDYTEGDMTSPLGCWFGPYDGREGGAIEDARLAFDDDGRFSLDVATQMRRLVDGEMVAFQDTFAVVGDYDRRGPLLELQLDGGDHTWYGTAGPDPRAPTTVVLGDYGTDGIAFGNGLTGTSRECGLAVLTPEGVEPDWSVSYEPGTRSESYDFEAIVAHEGAVWSLPLIFGRRANNRIEGGTLSLRPDGTYRIYIRDVVGDDYHESNTWRDDKESEGTYTEYGGLIAFDVGTSRLGFGVIDGAAMRVLVEQGPVWPMRIWGGADRLLVRN